MVCIGFFLLHALVQMRVPCKSVLHRFNHWLPAASMRTILERLRRKDMAQPHKLGLAQALDLEDYFLDTTCLKAPIHFPIDLRGRSLSLRFKKRPKQRRSQLDF